MLSKSNRQLRENRMTSYYNKCNDLAMKLLTIKSLCACDSERYSDRTFMQLRNLACMFLRRPGPLQMSYKMEVSE